VSNSTNTACIHAPPIKFEKFFDLVQFNQFLHFCEGHFINFILGRVHTIGLD
jgi:hypothetical protein